MLKSTDMKMVAHREECNVAVNVIDNFTNCLKDILGSEFVEEFQKENPTDWQQLMSTIQFQKCKSNVRLNLQITWAFGTAYREKTGKNIDAVINHAKARSGISFINGMLSLKPETVLNLFEPVVNQINHHIVKMLRQSKDISHIVLVGNMSESEILQNGIKQVLPEDILLIVADEPKLAHLKGAVKCGMEYTSLKSIYSILSDVEKHFVE